MEDVLIHKMSKTEMYGERMILCSKEKLNLELDIPNFKLGKHLSFYWNKINCPHCLHLKDKVRCVRKTKKVKNK